MDANIIKIIDEKSKKMLNTKNHFKMLNTTKKDFILASTACLKDKIIDKITEKL